MNAARQEEPIAVEAGRPANGAVGPLLAAPGRRYGERAIYAFLAACAVLSVVTTTAIAVSLLGPAIEFLGEVGLGEFLLGTSWGPTFEPPSFGVLPIVVGTFSVTLWGMLFAIPIGLGAAIYLSEYARPRVRRVVKPVLELLAGIPTVALGFFALIFITPLLQDVWPAFLGEGPNIFNVLAAGLALGLLIVPVIASISEDAMAAVPAGLREAAYALGATKAKVAIRVVFPAALSGIVASIILALSRAIGETMVVLIAAGNTPNLSFDPLGSVQTMTAFIGTTATGDIATGSITYKTVFAVALLLFVITLAMNLLSIRLVHRFREAYD